MTSANNDTRTVIIMWVWITYMLITVFYFVSYGFIEPSHSKVIYLGSSFATITYCAFDILKGFKHFMHKVFLVMCLLSISFNFMFMVLYYVWGIDDYKFKIVTFITIEIITATFVLISGSTRGLFKNGKGML